MADEWSFWREQLAGGHPATTPGTPHPGFYVNDWRESYRNPKPTVGGPRRKVRIIPGVCAIWRDDGAWLCRTDTPESVRLAIGGDDVDDIFSRVCRKAISFEEYGRRVNEYEQCRNARAKADDAISNPSDGEQVHDGPEAIRADAEGDRVPAEWDA